MAISESFKEAVEQGNITRVRVTLKNSFVEAYRQIMNMQI